MNYQAFGQYTALVAQAHDAAGRRFAHMTNAAAVLRRAADMPQSEGDLDQVAATLDLAVAADVEMRTALQQANVQADLCGQRQLHLAELQRNKG